MGETKAELSRTIWLTRIIMASVVLFVGIIAALQLIISPSITIKFNTGVGAQQLAAVQVKKGGDVELPTPLKPGAYFVGWATDPNSGTIITDLKNVTKGTTLYAVWDGVEKYGVLMVNGVPYDNVNIFKASDDGISASELNAKWVLPDDFTDDAALTARDDIKYINSTRKVLLRNNYQRFLGWQYLNKDGQTDQLLYRDGHWTWQTADGQVTAITDENLFYPPNYKTTFHAILEYRKINFFFYNYGDSTDVIAPPLSGDSNTSIYAPQYTANAADATAQFSHWQLESGDLLKYAPDAVVAQMQVSRFVPGERITVDPLWYYLGSASRLEFAGYNSDDVVIDLIFRATEWQTPADKYTLQMVSDTDSGKERVSIPEASLDTLSLSQPVVYYQNSLWLYKDPEQQITTYNFVDHNGVIHQIATNQLTEPYTEIKLGGSDGIAFNHSRAINITVNYRSALKNIALRFNYGTDLYVLPNYRYNAGDTVTGQTVYIGNRVMLPNAERYLKNDWLFYGWKIKGDPTGKIYFAGEYFTIPNLAANTLEFTAVWRESRLLYDFDFNGGAWAHTPDFKVMKGAYGNRVQIVPDIPVRFGYNFTGWMLNGQVRQPGDYIIIGDDIQMLSAQWSPKQLQIDYFYWVDNQGNRNRPSNVSSVVEGQVTLKPGPDTYFHTFMGWQIGDNVYPANTPLTLDADTVAKLNPEAVGDTLKITITAKQVTRFATIHYYGVNGEPLRDAAWVSSIMQGDKFINYAPFSLDHHELDMYGQEFLGWEFSDGKSNNRTAVTHNTIVPTGVTTIQMFSTYTPKSFVIEYRGFNDEIYCDTDGRFYPEAHAHNHPTLRSYGATVDLLTRAQVAQSLPTFTDEWGTFVGWSFEKDYVSSNPAIIYDVLENPNPRLQLVNVDDMLATPYYQINIDKHAVKIGNTDNYKLVLYAVYAKDSLKINYQGLTQFNVPVFIGSDRSTSVMGGTTVGPEAADYDTYGLSVLDEAGLYLEPGENFVAWRAQVPEGSKPSLKAEFENRLWFPGDLLPAIDFDLTFTPVFATQNTTTTITVGTATYRVASLGEITTHELDAVDIVVLPAGDYTVATGAIKINGAVTKVVIPANGTITLAPQAIQATQLVDCYLGDNVLVSGSPVISTNFQNYLVRKGYWVWDNNERVISFVNQTTKYNFAASLRGLLVEGQTLLAVPASTKLGTTALHASLRDFNITTIASYAMIAVNSLDEINLAIDNLQIDARAIFTTTARTIVLPATANAVDAECIAGYQPRLTTVMFGTANSANYAFVDGGVVYYGANGDKSHIMYVLPSVPTRNLAYTTNDLLLDPAVRTINEYALSSLNWAQINSVTADAPNQNMNIAALKGVPTNVPIFVNKDNAYLGGMTQTYEKVFIFQYNSQDNTSGNQERILKYGQEFTVFDPKENNPYDFIFDKPWHKFVGWFSNGNFYTVGEFYRVGIDYRLLVTDNVIFDATEPRCWQEYPIKFNIYDPNKNAAVEVTVKDFINDYGVQYTLAEVIDNTTLLSQLYLPGLDLSFTRNGVKYQFIGWGTRASAPYNFDDWLWNNADANSRILPNGGMDTKLNAGMATAGVYNYYALYDRVSKNLDYTLTADNTFTVKQGVTPDTNIYIPYAHYNGRFMAPVMKIADSAFNNLANAIDCIVIGAAIAEIGDSAFAGTNASLEFMHRGPNIQINHETTHLYQLKIGNNAFKGNTKITILTLPTMVYDLGDYAFANCVNLQGVYGENSGQDAMLTRLGNMVFAEDRQMDSNYIVSLILNDSHTIRKFDQVGEGIFKNTNLKMDITWNGWQGATLLHAGGSHGKVTVTQNIKGYAFAHIEDITEIEISNASVKIANNAFANLSSKIAQIDLRRASINNVEDDAFKGLSATIAVRVVSEQNWSSRFKGVSFTSRS